MLERIVGAASKELPLTEHVFQEVLTGGIAAAKTETFSEYRVGNMVARVMSGNRGPVLDVPGHSTMYQHALGLKLHAVDGSKFSIFNDTLHGEFPDGTKISQRDNFVSTTLPNGLEIRQEKLADNQLSMSVGMNRFERVPLEQSPHRYELGGGVYAENSTPEKTGIFLPDGSSIRNSNWGFDIRRSISGDIGSARHHDISILNNYSTGSGPILQLHDRSISNMYGSMFANGTRNDGIKLRVDHGWTDLKYLLP